MPQPCPRKLRPIALADVLMKLAESCVTASSGLGTPDAAVLIARIVRGWANDMAVAPKVGQDADVVLPIDVENAWGRAFRSTCLEAARSACLSLLRFVRHNGNPETRGCGSDTTMAGLLTATRGGWQGSRAMQVMFALELEFASSSLTSSLHARSRGLACRMT